MGTKRPGCTLFDTPSNINTSDRKLHPGGKISRDPSPRPAMTAQSEQEIDKREDDWRREREMERMREKTRHRDMELREQYYERDRAPAPRPREGDREGSRDRRQQDRRIHVRSYVEKDTEREEERGTNKGDTFPRMRKSSAESARRRPELDEDRGERRPKRVETDYERRDRDRDGQRQSRPREEGTNTGRRPAEDKKSQQVQRYRSDVGFQDRRREVHSDPRVRRERSAAREREKPRSNMEKWETRRPSPHRRQDREIYLDRSERGKAQREGKRNSRSEGDSDEREQRRERARSRERDRAYHQSRSEGDNMDKMEADRSRRKGVRKEYTGRSHDRREDERNREYSKQRRDRETTDRKTYSRWDDTTGRSSQAQRETAPRVQPRVQSSGEWSSDMDSEVRYRRRRDSYEETGSGRESTTHRERDVKEQRNPERAAERNPAREPTRTERQERERKEVQDAERRGSVPEQKKMWLDPQRGRTSRDEYVDRGRHTSGDERSVVERGRGEPDERYRGRHGERNQYRGDTERETEGVSVDGDDVGEDERGKKHPSDSGGEIEGSQRRDAEGDKVTDNTDESDREEEGGRDSWGRSESEGGSGKPGEDGFETVSSGWDEEDEREEAFEDCQEFFEGEVACNGPSSVALEGEEGAMGEEEMVEEKEEGRGSKKKYVFCVIGTLPQQKTNEVMPQQIDQTKGAEIENPYLESLHHSSDSTQQPQDALHVTLSGNDEFPIINNQDTKSRSYLNSPREERAAIGESTEVNMRYRVSPELQNTDTGVGMRSKSERPYTPIETVKRDSQTERLLNKWRENNKEEVEQDPEVPSNPYGEVLSQVNFEQIQPILDGLASGAMSPEEVEAIRIRMSGAWSIAEEPKRHSQAPHLKWAKNVVREILGRSEDKDLDEPKTEVEGNRGVSQSEAAMEKDPQQEEEEEEGAQGTGEMPGVRLSTDEEPSEPEPEEEESLEVEGSRGMRQKQAEMHADQCTAMHGDTCTYTNTDTLLDTEGEECPSMDKQTESSGLVKVEKADDRVELSETEKEAMENREMEMYLSLSSTLYKPNSCPILNYDSDSDLLVPSREDEDQEGGDRMGESEEERQGEEHGDSGSAEEVGEVTQLDGTEAAERKTVGGDLKSSYSFRDLGPEARFRRRGIRKTTERRKGELVEVEEEMEDVGRDRRTRIFSTTDDEDDKSKSWGEVDLRNVLDTIERRKRNSRFFNAAQLYQQYSEAAQNFEIQRQARSDVVSIIEDAPRSPLTSPKPARRPLPPLPPVQHPHSLSHTHSITSVKSLPVPETGRRPSSPRLSACLTQSSTLWRELPGVRNSLELEELTEDQRRLQEVRFEVVTSEASYCRSLDIVVEHFVKSKQLGALLTTQDRNWLFSRLADVRAISHSFLSKLEERVESDMMQFTVCDIITRHCQRFKMVYVPYLTNQSYQDATYQRLMIENSGFKRIVDKLERSPVCQRLPLRSFLVLPFQRITRIKLLVQNIVKRTTPGTMEATHAIKSLKLLEKLIQESNDSITQMKSIESLVSLSAKVDFECRTLPLISQSRRLVREGPVSELMDFSLKDTERHIYLHLFNDYLLLSLQKDGGRFTVIDHSPVSDLRAENCRVKLHSLQKNLFRLHIAPKAKLLRTDTQSDKLRWISALSRPHPEIDYSAAQDFPQMQCIRAVVAQQSDELSLDKADIILVHQQSSDHWVEGTKLSDRHRGWVPESHLETISNSRVRERNLSDALKLTTAKAAV